MHVTPPNTIAMPESTAPTGTSGGNPSEFVTVETVDEVVVLEAAPAQLVANRSERLRVWHLLHAVGSVWEWCFGAVSMIVALAIVATIPILQVLSLGYLLEASGRVARTGRLRAGFIGVRQAARAGSIALGLWIIWLPLRLVSSLYSDAVLIDPDAETTRTWFLALVALSAVTVLHAIGACLRGGQLRQFFWPRPIRLVRDLFRPGAYARIRDTVWDFILEMRLPYFFWLGLRGLIGAVAWLIVPVSMLAVASRLKPGPGALIGLLGGVLMAFVLVHLPFLQARFAAANRLSVMFSLRDNRRAFARAPLAFFMALAVTLLLALPLYLLKIEIVPQEAAWLPSLLFVMSIFPARLLAGWACSRSELRTTPRHWFFRITSRLAMLPVVGFYVLLVYFTQYLSWYGVWSLYEQHAFLLPVPFLGL